MHIENSLVDYRLRRALCLELAIAPYLKDYMTSLEISSISASSSLENEVFSRKRTFSRICSGREAPIITELTAPSHMIQARAISAKDCPRLAAMVFSFEIAASFFSVRSS